MRWLLISSCVNGLASPRNIGSPTFAILILMSRPFSQKRRTASTIRSTSVERDDIGRVLPAVNKPPAKLSMGFNIWLRRL